MSNTIDAVHFNHIRMDEVMQSKGLVYLGTPYTHKNESVMQKRFEVANHATAHLIRSGLHVYSPVSHLHYVTKLGDFPVEWDFWADNCALILSKCCAMVILKQSGWDISVGLNEEYKIAVELEIPIGYINPVILSTS